MMYRVASVGQLPSTRPMNSLPCGLPASSVSSKISCKPTDPMRTVLGNRKVTLVSKQSHFSVTEPLEAGDKYCTQIDKEIRGSERSCFYLLHVPQLLLICSSLQHVTQRCTCNEHLPSVILSCFKAKTNA